MKDIGRQPRHPWYPFIHSSKKYYIYWKQANRQRMLISKPYLGFLRAFMSILCLRALAILCRPVSDSRAKSKDLYLPLQLCCICFFPIYGSPVYSAIAPPMNKDTLLLGFKWSYPSCPYSFPWLSSSLVAQRLKRLPAMRETRVRFLSWEDPLEKEMATYSSTPA